MSRILYSIIITLILSSSVHSQLDWSAFKEPDGLLQRLTIDPRISITSVDNDIDVSKFFRSQFLSRYSLSSVKENHVSNLNLQHNLIYNDNSNALSNLNSDIFFQFDHTYYISKRKGIFLRAQPTLFYEYNKREGESATHINQINGPVMVGYGRLENITSLYQAVRIERDLYSNDIYNQDKLFEVARALRSLDYNNALDTRMRIIDNNTKYLELLDSYGYAVDSFHDIARALDTYRFERPNFIFQGYEISAGLLPRFSFGEESDIVAIARAIYAKALSDKWHWSIQGEATFDFINYDLTDDYFDITNSFSYLPTARTNIGFNQRYYHSKSIKSLEIFVSVNYFVSPQLSLFLFSQIRHTNNNFQNDVLRLSHDMGLKYFFF